MAVVIKTEPNRFTQSETRIPLNRKAKDALVLGALIDHDRSVYEHPIFEDLAKFMRGSGGRGRTHYGPIEFTEGEIKESLESLERRDLVETYVKKNNEDSDELSYKPLISRDC